MRVVFLIPGAKTRSGEAAVATCGGTMAHPVLTADDIRELRNAR